MTKIVRVIEVLLVLLAVFIILTGFFLYIPDFSPFQYITFGDNVIPIASMITAWTTLLVAYAAFRTIQHYHRQDSLRKADARISEIVKWAEEIGTSILECGTPQTEETIRKVLLTESILRIEGR